MDRTRDVCDAAQSEVSIQPENDTISTSERSDKDDKLCLGDLACELDAKRMEAKGECRSKCGEYTESPFQPGIDIVRAHSSLDDNCSAGTYIPSCADLMSEGSDQNFELLEESRRGKKRRYSPEPDSYDVDDAHLDKVADRLEMELSRLESDNKQLISCFVTLGEQIQGMKNENNQMSSVISFCNEQVADTEDNPAFKLFKRSFDASMRDPVALAGISPTVRFLAELALMSGAIPHMDT